MPQESFFPPDPIIPSTVTRKKRIVVDPPDREQFLENLQVEKRSGKWMLFHDSIEMSPSTGLTRHDYAWQFIKKLVENNSSHLTGIIRAKCTTAWMGERHADPSSTFGVIRCFTANFLDKDMAEKAAIAIRQAYYYPENMFYKTDEATEANKYSYLGHRFVSIYKHTLEHEMFERDSDDPSRWNRV